MLCEQEELQILLLHTAMVYLHFDHAIDIHRKHSFPREPDFYTPLGHHVSNIPDCNMRKAFLENSQLHLGFILDHRTDSIVHDDCNLRLGYNLSRRRRVHYNKGP